MFSTTIPNDFNKNDYEFRHDKLPVKISLQQIIEIFPTIISTYFNICKFPWEITLQQKLEEITLLQMVMLFSTIVPNDFNKNN
jgi:hypothetical protein